MTNPVKAKLNSMTSGEVYEVLLGLKERFDDAAMMVFDVALDVLESKVSETEFLRLAENL